MAKFGTTLINLYYAMEMVADRAAQTGGNAFQINQLLDYFNSRAHEIHHTELHDFQPGLTGISTELHVCLVPDQLYRERVAEEDSDSIIDFDPRSRLMLVRDVPCTFSFLGILGLWTVRQATSELRQNNPKVEKELRRIEGLPLAQMLLQNVLHRDLSKDFAELIDSCTHANQMLLVQRIGLELERAVPASGAMFEPEARDHFIQWLVRSKMDARMHAELVR